MTIVGYRALPHKTKAECASRFEDNARPELGLPKAIRPLERSNHTALTL